jgi:hypothetical protein
MALIGSTSHHPSELLQKGPNLIGNIVGTIAKDFQCIGPGRRIALDRVEGYSVAEIAVKLGISTRAVERKL